MKDLLQDLRLCRPVFGLSPVIAVEPAVQPEALPVRLQIAVLAVREEPDPVSPGLEPVHDIGDPGIKLRGSVQGQALHFVLDPGAAGGLFLRGELRGKGVPHVCGSVAEPAADLIVRKFPRSGKTLLHQDPVVHPERGRVDPYGLMQRAVIVEDNVFLHVRNPPVAVDLILLYCGRGRKIYFPAFPAADIRRSTVRAFPAEDGRGKFNT